MKKVFSIGQIITIISDRLFCKMSELDDIIMFMNKGHQCDFCLASGILKHYSKFLLEKFSNLKEITIPSKNDWTESSAKEYLYFLELNYGKEFELNSDWFVDVFTSNTSECMSKFYANKSQDLKRSERANQMIEISF